MNPEQRENLLRKSFFNKSTSRIEIWTYPQGGDKSHHYYQLFTINVMRKIVKRRETSQ